LPAGGLRFRLISLLGELLKAGMIDRSGTFTDAVPPERFDEDRGSERIYSVPGR